MNKTNKKKNGVWTQFWDMHSGGSLKEKWQFIYIEAPQDKAKLIFYNRFGHNPDRVTCTCCGNDYSVTESKSLLEITKYHRGYGKYSFHKRISLANYKYQSDVLVITKKEITKEERTGEIPEQGYVWQD